MNLNTVFFDKVAISLSSLCVAHCLIFPILAILIPNFLALGLNTESFHFWMVISVIPTSIYALSLGCKKHNQTSVLIIGVTGLCCLIITFVLGANSLTEIGEKSLTTLGALIISYAHVKNFKLCQHHDECSCSNNEN
jgi:hypothetical protein